MTGSVRASYDYLPALDGLRAVSIMMVVMAHAGLRNIIPGGLGVLVFFAISGFLITRQMIAEVEQTGDLRIGDFYLRRMARLLPALLFYIALFVPLLLALGSQITFMHVLSGLFYFSNYYYIFHNYPLFNPFPITWSLAVEEHYYIIFPFLIVLCRRNLRHLLPWLLVLVTAALLWRIALYEGCSVSPDWSMCSLPGRPRAHGTDAIFDCILYGALTALALHYYPDAMRRRLINAPAFALALAGLAASVLIRDAAFRETLRYSLQSICVCVIMMNILFGARDTARRFLSHPVAIGIGRRSYSLYLFHYGVLISLGAWYGEPGNFRHAGDVLLYFLLAFALAAFSYRFVERPMMAWRKRFGAHAMAAA